MRKIDERTCRINTGSEIATAKLSVNLTDNVYDIARETDIRSAKLSTVNDFRDLRLTFDSGLMHLDYLVKVITKQSALMCHRL